jgi:hypothetical protein
VSNSHDASSPPPADGEGDRFEPSDAAALMASARVSARRAFEPHTPFVLAVLAVAVAVLGAYGTLWLSVRGQDPYVGPSLVVIGGVYAIIAVLVVVSLVAYNHATTGVRRIRKPQDAWEGLALGVPWIAVFVVDGALKADGFPAAIVYGVFDAAAPWLVVGAAMAGLAAGRQDRWRMAIGLGLVLAATVAAFFGPAGCWGVLAVAGFAGLITGSVVQYVRLQRP